MACCTGYCVAEAQFDGKVAEHDLRRYRRRGADVTTRLLLEELRRQPLEGRRLLDVGGGIGVISAELADTGVASVTMVEASPAYLEVARREVGSRYGSRPTQFILGDFAIIADTLPQADVVTLDRVVCCYADGEALLRKAAQRTLHLFAFTYPRDRWYISMMIALENFWRRLTGKEFRAFVHAPERMGVVLDTAGLVRATRRETLVRHSTSIAVGGTSDTHLMLAASGVCHKLFAVNYRVVGVLAWMQRRIGKRSTRPRHQKRSAGTVRTLKPRLL